MSQHHQLIKNDPRWKAARLACFERDDYRCVDCDGEEDLQADHLVELAVLLEAGDVDLAFDIDNLATRCGPCNRKRYLGQEHTIRHQWVNPAYPDLVPLIWGAGF